MNPQNLHQYQALNILNHKYTNNYFKYIDRISMLLFFIYYLINDMKFKYLLYISVLPDFPTIFI